MSVGPWLRRNPMLLPRDWCLLGHREARHQRRYRPRNWKSDKGASRMGQNNVCGEEEGSEDNAQVRLQQSKYIVQMK